MNKIKRKFDYVELCESRGELLEGKIGNTLLILDFMGFNHEMDVASIRRGASLSIRSVVKSQKSDYFVRTIIDKWGDDISHFDFSEFEYKSVFKESDVICKEHGRFKAKPTNILKSRFACRKCLCENISERRSFTTESYIEKCKEVHGDIYDYSKTLFSSNRSYVTVTCREHGDFKVLARTHSSDSQACGCFKCGIKNSGRNREQYTKGCQKGANVYLLLLIGEGEKFIKVGLSKKVKDRITRIKRESSYDVRLLHTEFYEDAGVAWDVEPMLHKEFEGQHYTPNIKFGGSTECFDILIQDEVIKLLKCAA